jgi:voltage-gated potassium channel Kch
MGSTKPEESGNERWLIWTLAVAVVAFVLGVVGLYLYNPEPLPDLVYHSLQLFVLGSDPLQGDGQDNLPLEIARLLAPATTIYGIFRLGRAILRDRLHRRAVARAVGHAVVTGGSAASLVLAQRLHDDGMRVVVVGNDDDAVARRRGIAVVPGDPRELTTLRAAGLRGASVLFACSPVTADNAAVVLAAGAIDGRRSRLEALARVSNDELVEALRVQLLSNAAYGRRVMIDFFSLEDIAARVLLKSYPQPAESVGIVGYDRFGQALLRAILRAAPTVRAPTITVIGAGERPGHAGQHGAEEPRIRFTPRRQAAEDGYPALVFVCLPDEDDALNTALRLTRDVPGRVVLCLRRQSPFGQALKETPQLDIFGILDAACDRQQITDEAIIGRTARKIHQRYVESCAARGDTVLTNPSMRPWAELADHLRESNYAQAEHLREKMITIDTRIVIDRPGLPRFAFTDDEIIQLARLEHDRWVEERSAAGFVYGPVRTGKQHPDLVDWPNLSDESRDKDIDAVRNIPELLAEVGLVVQRRAG